MTLRTIAICTAAIGFWTAPVRADEPAKLVFSFHYDTEMPVERLYQTIKARAAEVCRQDHSDTMRFYAARFDRQCRKDIAAQIVNALNMPKIVAYHRHETRQDEGVAQSANLGPDHAR